MAFYDHSYKQTYYKMTFNNCVFFLFCNSHNQKHLIPAQCGVILNCFYYKKRLPLYLTQIKHVKYACFEKSLKVLYLVILYRNVFECNCYYVD